LEGNFYDSSHEIFEVFNHEGIPFIESVDYEKRETQQRDYWASTRSNDEQLTMTEYLWRV
jgi:hypothetical protein